MTAPKFTAGMFTLFKPREHFCKDKEGNMSQKMCIRDSFHTFLSFSVAMLVDVSGLHLFGVSGDISLRKYIHLLLVCNLPRVRYWLNSRYNDQLS